MTLRVFPNQGTHLMRVCSCLFVPPAEGSIIFHVGLTEAQLFRRRVPEMVKGPADPAGPPIESLERIGKGPILEGPTEKALVVAANGLESAPAHHHAPADRRGTVHRVGPGKGKENIVDSSNLTEAAEVIRPRWGQGVIAVVGKAPTEGGGSGDRYLICSLDTKESASTNTRVSPVEFRAASLRDLLRLKVSSPESEIRISSSGHSYTNER